MLQLADLLLIITADLLLLGNGDSVDDSLANLSLLRNAHLVVDDTGSVVALGALGTLAVVFRFLDSSISSSNGSSSSISTASVSVVVVVALELGGGAAGLVVQGLVDVRADRVADLDALEVVPVGAVGLVHGVANTFCEKQK